MCNNNLFSFSFCFYCVYIETEKGIFDAILEGVIDFESQPWPSISRSAKDLVRKMLTQDPRKRITSAQVLGINYSLPFSFSFSFPIK